MKTLWVFFGGHHKIGLVLEVISMHFRVFFKVMDIFGGGQNFKYFFGVLDIPDIFLG